MRGRKRTPTAVLEMRGAFRKHPERRKEREGEPELPLGVGDPPKSFDAAQVECWKELAERGQAWLTQADVPLLESAAKLLCRDRRNELNNSEGKRYDQLCASLGFGPVARTRVKAIPQTGAENTKAKRFFGAKV